VLYVLRVLGEMVGVTGPVPRLADLDDALLVAGERFFEFLT